MSILRWKCVLFAQNKTYTHDRSRENYVNLQRNVIPANNYNSRSAGERQKSMSKLVSGEYPDRYLIGKYNNIRGTRYCHANFLTILLTTPLSVRHNILLQYGVFRSLRNIYGKINHYYTVFSEFFHKTFG